MRSAKCTVLDSFSSAHTQRLTEKMQYFEPNYFKHHEDHTHLWHTWKADKESIS